MQRQSERRFDEIYQRHREEVTLYVRRRAAADAVEDIVAETFLVCWRKLADVPREPLPWLYAVARKTLANHHRALARRDAVAAAPRAEDVFLPIEHDDVLANAFARLGEPDRELLRLVAWEQLSLREAARALGCSQAACRVRLHRARRRLALHLDAVQASDAAAHPRPRPEGATS